MLSISNRVWPRLSSCAFLLATSVCQAQTFPSSGWLPLAQQGTALIDPYDGNPPYVAAIDVVGGKSAPSAFVSSDANYLYFRLLVAGYPLRIGGRPGYLSNAWMCLLDTDQNAQTYELLTALDGIGGSVDLDQNTSTAKMDSLDDPAESTLATYATGTNAEAVASGSAFGGAADYFVDWAVSWTDLANGGLSKSAAFRLVCGTSTSANSLSGGDVLDGASGSASFSADASDAMLCDDSGCRYDAVFGDGFDGR